jgi:hypothetical protein
LLWGVNRVVFASNISILEILSNIQGGYAGPLRQRTIFLISGNHWTLLDLSHGKTSEEHFVDLALRFETLALCAVFAFVGAILLGAF